MIALEPIDDALFASTPAADPLAGAHPIPPPPPPTYVVVGADYGPNGEFLGWAYALD